MIEKVNPVVLTDNETGKKYTLDFDRATVKRIERNGFALADCERFPSLYEDLFYFSFLKNHEREVTRKKTDTLLESLGGIADAPEGLFPRLVDLYVQTFKTLDDEKNVRVTVEL